MSKPTGIRRAATNAVFALEEYLLSLPHDHPLQISIRTYGLALSLSLVPVLLPFIISGRGRAKLGGPEGLKRALKREFGVTGFAFAMTTAIGGGAYLQHIWKALDARADPEPLGHDWSSVFLTRAGRILQRISNACNLTAARKAFLCNSLTSLVALILLQARRRAGPQAAIPLTPPFTRSPEGIPRTNRPSPTLDLTLLLFVRAMDAGVQACLSKYALRLSQGKDQDAKEWRRKLTRHSDAFLFWVCSARIMWCFFYQPERLPRSYVKWITSLADIDNRLVLTLRAIRSGHWVYGSGGRYPELLTSMAQDIGVPSSWGNPAMLPPRGGLSANNTWAVLGVMGRNGVGGLPCEIVHGGMDRKSCTANSARRGAKAFVEALLIYLPVHFLPMVLRQPSAMLQIRSIIPRLLSAMRSATFLSAFVSSIWMSVCLTRTLLLARLFPSISHNFWDGPFGCILAGCLACGSSIWIEEGRRRGEMALYVLPRAVRSCLPDGWVRSGNKSTMIAERLAFVLSLASLLTAAVHRPDILRGLSRWTLEFVMNGPNAALWRRKRQLKLSGNQVEDSDPATNEK